MKTYRKPVLSFICLSLFFLLWGCLEYSIVTRVTPEGKLVRTISVKGDSADIFTGSFRVPSDSSWKITTRFEPRNNKDSNDSEVYVYEASKEFEDFDALNNEFYKDVSFNDRNNIRVNLEKKFMFFFTRYRYTETYAMLFPFRSVAVNKFLSNKELRIHLANDNEIFYSADRDSILFVADSANTPELSEKDSLRFRTLRDSIEQKFENWQKVNIYNEFYDQILIALENLKISSEAMSDRAGFYHWLDSTGTFETGLESDKQFVDAAADYLHIASGKLMGANKDGFDTFQKKFKVATFTLESYTNEVQMPGKITQTNAKTKTGKSSANWTFKIDNFYATDYSMTVESRLMHAWAMIAAGAVLVFLLVLFYRKKDISPVQE